jgi:osmotically-inducible protein OsmY
MAPLMYRFVIFAGAALFLTACASSRALDDSVSDIATNAELKGVIFTDRSHDYSDIDLTVFEGRLLLTGTMPTEDGRKKMVENAWKAGGVSQVIDAIVVGERTSFGQGFEDTRIDQTLRAKLIAASNVRSGDFKIAVSNAAIHLLGSTRTQAELDEAIKIARTIRGVKKVAPFVTVRTLDNNQTPAIRN